MIAPNASMENGAERLDFTENWELLLKRAFLGKGVSGERRSLRCFDDFYAHGGGVGCGDSGGAEHGKLAEDFVVDLGDQIILAVGIATPDLPELDRVDRHGILPLAP